MERSNLFACGWLFLQIYWKSKLDNETLHEVILRLKSIFAKHGIPLEMFLDNGLQYSSMGFTDFSKDYKFVYTTSSPKLPQSNGETEQAVRTIKTLLQKADDPYAPLLAYWSTSVVDTALLSYWWIGNFIPLCQLLPLNYNQQFQTIPDWKKERRQWEKCKQMTLTCVIALDSSHFFYQQRQYGKQSNRHQQLLLSCHCQDNIRFKLPLECYAEIVDTSIP